MQRAMADEKKESANDRSGNPMLAAGTEAARVRPGQQNAYGHGVANAGRDQRRNGLHGVADRQIRRSPHQVDRGKGEHHLDGIAMALRSIWVGDDHGSASYVYHSFPGESFTKKLA